MRALLAGLLLVLALGCVDALTRPGPSAGAAAQETQPERQWRRTASGWEQADRWIDAKPRTDPLPAFHPLYFAALQLLLSIMALVAFEPGVKANQKLRRPATRAIR